MKIVVGCPTRDRIPSAINLARSVARTSKDAMVVFYVDNDQRQHYQDQFEFAGQDRYERVRMVGGDRVGPVKAANEIAAVFDCDWFGFVPDDCEFTTQGWDSYLLGLVPDPRKTIAVASPSHPFGDHIDVPFVTRAWLDVIGDFAPVALAHWCWPTVISLLAEVGNAEIRCDPDRFYIEHKMQMSEGANEKLPGDAVTFYMWCVHEFPQMLAKLRKAIEAQND